MAALPILKMGNPILRQIATDVAQPDTNEIRDLIVDMKDSMAAAGGVGLAAPQIGVSLNVVIFEVPGSRIEQEDGEPSKGIGQTILINPVIEPTSDEMALGWEGCLSVPGLRGLVPRYTHIYYQGVNLDGETIQREATGFHARVVQHECDHLTGILYPERMTDMRHLVYESEMSSFMAAFEKKNLAD
jgi:peptide deformylase